MTFGFARKFILRLESFLPIDPFWLQKNQYEELRFRRCLPLACGIMGITCSSYYKLSLQYIIVM